MTSHVVIVIIMLTCSSLSAFLYLSQHAAARLQKLKRKREVLLQRKDETPEAQEAYRVLGEA